MNKIVFKYSPGMLGIPFGIIDPPVPATTTIPEWYKSMPIVADGSKERISPGNYLTTNTTMKACSPFLDAVTTGYMFNLPMDVMFEKQEDGSIAIKWRSDGDFITIHTPNQFPGLPAPAGTKDNSVAKWTFPFNIETPPGYSCLFTHPFNRNDLPFRTLTGVVETDEYPAAIQFPFQLTVEVTDFLIIEKGTPVCQILPFKREDWKSSSEELSHKDSISGNLKLKSKILRSYKRQWWKKKKYI